MSGFIESELRSEQPEGSKQLRQDNRCVNCVSQRDATWATAVLHGDRWLCRTISKLLLAKIIGSSFSLETTDPTIARTSTLWVSVNIISVADSFDSMRKDKENLIRRDHE